MSFLQLMKVTGGPVSDVEPSSFGPHSHPAKHQPEVTNNARSVVLSTILRIFKLLGCLVVGVGMDPGMFGSGNDRKPY